MNVEEIRNLETSEIENQVKDLKQQLFTLRFQHATGQLENPNELNKLKYSHSFSFLPPNTIQQQHLQKIEPVFQNKVQDKSHQLHR